MGKLYWFIILIILLFPPGISYSKTGGNFKCYHQSTDKEIAIESSTGKKILFRALNQHTVGISVFESNEKIELTKPDSIFNDETLAGSIYIEELDELMQITSTVDDGFMIRIDKYPLAFTFHNKKPDDAGLSVKNKVRLEKGNIQSIFMQGWDENFEIIFHNDRSITKKPGDSGYVPTKKIAYTLSNDCETLD